MLSHAGRSYFSSNIVLCALSSDAFPGSASFIYDIVWLPINVSRFLVFRFSGSQHCGHVHCAYQYREHYHCMDPECNYQVSVSNLSLF